MARRLDAVLNYALALPSAGARSASVGFCWGGGVSFNYSARQSRLNAAVVYYGTPPDKDALARIRCPVLGLYGGNDARVTSTVADTAKTMAGLKKSYTYRIFDGAGHAFLRQQSGQDGANEKASLRAWPETIRFLKKNLE